MPPQNASGHSGGAYKMLTVHGLSDILFPSVCVGKFLKGLVSMGFWMYTGVLQGGRPDKSREN